MRSGKSSDHLVLPLLCLSLLLAAVPALAEPRPLLAVGETAPTCRLQDLDGKTHEFPVPHRWNVIFFWSLFCHTCIDEMPLMAEELRALTENTCHGYFISLDTVRMKTGLTNFLKKRSLDCRVLLEEVASSSYLTADSFGVRTTPATFLISPEGKVVIGREGPFDSAEMFRILRNQQSGGGALSDTVASSTTASAAAPQHPSANPETLSTPTVGLASTTPPLAAGDSDSAPVASGDAALEVAP